MSTPSHAKLLQETIDLIERVRTDPKQYNADGMLQCVADLVNVLRTDMEIQERLEPSDTARLDWIEKNGSGPSLTADGKFIIVVRTSAIGWGNMRIFTHGTLRGVIDRARATVPEPIAREAIPT